MNTAALLRVVRRTFAPQKVVALAHPGADAGLIPLLDGRQTRGAARAFACNAVDRRLQETLGTCERTCDNIAIPQFRDECEVDVQLTGDPAWACTSEYVNAGKTF